jgi:hypothetical protein
MSQWNQDYKNKPYNTYGGAGFYSGDGWMVVLGLALMVGFGILAIAIFSSLVEKYGIEKTTTYTFFGLLGSFVVCSILVGLYYWILEWWDRLADRWFGVPKCDVNTYNLGNNINKTTTMQQNTSVARKVNKVVNKTTLLAGEREKPPRAAFFGRLDGQPLESLGSYEEQWLSPFELSHWYTQKEYKRALKDDSTSENDEFSDLCINTTTKIDY